MREESVKIFLAMKRGSLLSSAFVLILTAGCYESYNRMATPDAVVEPDLPVVDLLDGEPVPELPEDVPEECHDRTFDVSRGAPDLLILLDRSNSMWDGGYWSPSVRAVKEIVERWQDQIAFGFAVFPSRLCMHGSFMCIPTTSIDVDPEVHAYDAVEEALSATSTCGGTPIAESLDFVRRYFRDLEDGRNHHLLLVTDGAPNCNSGLDRFSCICTWTGCATVDTDSLNCLDDARTYAEARDLAEDGVLVHVMGLNEAASDWGWVMDAIAEEGGTDEAILVGESAAIEAAMESVAGDVAPCRFHLTPGEVIDPDTVMLLVDGYEVPWDPGHTDGWDWFDEDIIDFHGPSCDRIVAGDVETVTVRIDCM